jgi:hypothetical protein
MNIKLASESLDRAKDIVAAIAEDRPIKNCLYGIFANENEYLTTTQAVEAYKIALEDAARFIF